MLARPNRVPHRLARERRRANLPLAAPYRAQRDQIGECGHGKSCQKPKRGNHDAAERRAHGPDRVEADGEQGHGSRDIAAVDDIANRGLPGGIVKSTPACDQEAEAEDHPRTDKAQRHNSGQHRRSYHHQAPAGEHDPATAEIIGEGSGEDGQDESGQVR